MDLTIKSYVMNNKDLFEDVADEYCHMENRYDTEYTILNYEKILSEMIEYMNGYIKYMESGNDKYDGKIIATTKSFYDNMFESDNYRTTIVLSDFKNIAKVFLEKTKELQALLENQCENKTCSELCSLCEMTDKQYKKIGKVYRDDMRIYLWLTTSKSQVFRKNIDSILRGYFYDKTTPVMHIK